MYSILIFAQNNCRISIIYNYIYGYNFDFVRVLISVDALFNTGFKQWT